MLFKLVATLAFTVLTIGVLVRKHRPLHPFLMATGIALDTLVVVILELDRSVVEGAFTKEYSIFEYGHIGSSTIAFALYFPVVYFGAMRIRNKLGRPGRLWHIRFGLTAYTFRAIGFVLMFTV